MPKPRGKSSCPSASQVSIRRRFGICFGLPTGAARLNIRRVVADAKPGYPDRVELRDAEPGETLLLLNYLHQPAETPYKSGHAIFIREGAVTAYEGVDEIARVPPAPADLASRLRRVRHDGRRGSGEREVDAAIERLLENPAASYIHALRRRGCYRPDRSGVRRRRRVEPTHHRDERESRSACIWIASPRGSSTRGSLAMTGRLSLRPLHLQNRGASFQRSAARSRRCRGHARRAPSRDLS